MKQFAIIGLGYFGSSVAVALAKQGHEILVIDSDPNRIDEIKEFVTQAIVADARNKKVLYECVHKDMDAAIVGIGDENKEIGILVTLYLKELGLKNIIVKATNPDYCNILTLIGATDVISPEKEEAARLAEKLGNPNLLDYIPLVPEYSIVEIAVPDTFAGKTLKELQLRNKYNIQVIGIKTILTDKFDFVPDANYKIHPDSTLIVIGKKSNIDKINF